MSKDNQVDGMSFTYSNFQGFCSACFVHLPANDNQRFSSSYITFSKEKF